MRTVVELSEKDIIATIARSLKVDETKVKLIYSEVWEGYAQNEHKKPVVSAEVDVKGVVVG